MQPYHINTSFKGIIITSILTHKISSRLHSCLEHFSLQGQLDIAIQLNVKEKKKGNNLTPSTEEQMLLNIRLLNLGFGWHIEMEFTISLTSLKFILVAQRKFCLELDRISSHSLNFILFTEKSTCNNYQPNIKLENFTLKTDSQRSLSHFQVKLKIVKRVSILMYFRLSL